MFGDKPAIATLGVKNLDAAKKFYEGILGLTQIPTKEPVLSYKCGNGSLLVYESQFAGTNQATGVTWNIDNDIQGFVKSLRTKGVAFEHYDFPGVTLDGDLHVIGEIRNAWFKDPDGNIHSLVGSA